MSPFRVYVKTKIHEGKENLLLPKIAELVEAVKESEPATLQYEAFHNPDSNHIIWIESYKTAEGFDAHLANPKVHALQPQLMSLMEVEESHFYTEPTKTALSGIDQMGLPYEIVKAYPGTDRLDEATENEPELQLVGTAEVSDLDAFLAASARLENAAAKQKGILCHNVFNRMDNKVAYLEAYTDQNGLMDWVNSDAANELFPIISAYFTSMQMNVLGNVNSTTKAFLDNWGMTYYNQVAGFSRFQEHSLKQVY